MPPEDPASPTVDPAALVVAIGVVFHGVRVLVTRRPDHVPLGGYWEFPGGKLEPGETPTDAAVRELAEEVALRVTARFELPATAHDYGDRVIELRPVVCTTASDAFTLLQVADAKWIEPGELPAFTFPPASGPVVERVMREHADWVRRFDAGPA